MMPHEHDIAPSPPASGPVRIEPPLYNWHHKFCAVVLILLCVEIGLFLLVIPWTEYWDRNYLFTLVPGWRPYWLNPFVRGAVSGLGAANLYLSLVEIFGLKRFAKR
ncbi:MAG TPA: hypothetical protein VKV17_02280 [Bryobacteraceae bacterium]|nr:hypothetical protein [Bryobacteraceae bacterium]